VLKRAIWYVFPPVVIFVGWGNVYWDWQLNGADKRLTAFLAAALITAVVVAIIESASRILQRLRGERPVRTPRVTYPVGRVKREDVDASGRYRRSATG
jgi:hypothetical protein